MKNISICLFLLSFLVLVNCTNSEIKKYERIKQERLEKERELKALSRVGALPKEVKSPADNLPSKEKIALGKLLFFDPILSGDKEVACATCHHPNNGYAEFRDLSIGVNGRGLNSKRFFKHPNDIPFVKRNSQTVLNTAFNGIDRYNNYDPKNAPMFWDVRVKSLEEQALEPIKAFEEMRGHHYEEEEIVKEVIQRLKAIPKYQELFTAVFHEKML